MLWPLVILAATPSLTVRPDGAAVLAPGLSVRLERLCRGACVSLPVREQRSGPGRAVTLEHEGGVTETFTPVGGAIEHSFLVQGGPMCHGDLTLELAVSAREVRPSAEGHQLISASGERVTYGRAFVVRPSGEKVPIRTERTTRGLMLRVPARVADAPGAWPMLIDPEISGTEKVLEAPLDNMGNFFREPTPQLYPRLAAGLAPGSYYVVWVDLRERLGPAIWGTLTSGTNPAIDLVNKVGTELSGPQPNFYSSPAVDTYLGSAQTQRGFLAVWENPFSTTIYFRRVSLSGVPLDGPNNPLTSAGRLPSVACVGTRCLVAWLDGTGVGGREMTMNLDGGYSLSPIRISAQTGARWVTLASAPEQRAIAAAVMTVEPNDAGTIAVTYLFDDAGVQTVQVGMGADIDTQPAIAQGGGDAGTAVAWITPNAGGQRVSAVITGPGGALTMPVLVTNTAYSLTPALGWTGTDFFLSYSEASAVGAATLQHLRFGRGPSMVLPAVAVMGTYEAYPTIGAPRSGSSQVVVAFQRSRAGFGVNDIELRRYDPAGTGAAQELVLSRSANAQAEPAVLALPSGKFLVAWADTRRAAFDPPANIALAQMDTEGVVGAVTVETESLVGDWPALAALQSDQLLVWKDHASGVYARRLNGSTPMGMRSPVSVGPEEVDSSTEPSLASTGTRVLTAWTAHGGLWVRRFDSVAGPDPSPSELVPVDGGAEYARAAWDGTQFVVVWNTRRDPRQLAAAVFHPVSMTPVYFPADISMSDHARPAIASDGKGRIFIAWTEASANMNKIFGLVRDTAPGSNPTTFAIAANTAGVEQQHMNAVWDGEKFLLAYRGMLGLDIATISADGSRVAPSSIVNGGIGRPQGRNPALGVMPSGDGVLVYDMYDGSPSVATTRLFMRQVAVERDGGPSDGGSSDGGALDGGGPKPPPLQLPGPLAVKCTQPLDTKFQSEARGEWKLVEGPGALDADGNYTWQPGKNESGTFTLKVKKGSSEGTTTVVVGCPEGAVLTFKTSSCGCGASGLTPVGLLALLLLRRRRRVLLMLGLLGCGRTSFYEARPSTVTPPPPPPISYCGDGVKDMGEACDDGDGDATDDCLNDCSLARCGDGLVHAGVEACDDGNAVEDDECTSRCRLTTCGNGRRDPGEACDDGNADDTDACSSTCLAATCGDGHVFAGHEPCDDGNSSNTDDCTNACLLPRCGDGFTHAGVEKCDDGNTVNDDFCTNACELPVCGDGRKAGGEECDLGSMNGDRPAFLISQPSGTSIATDALVRAKTAVLFYDYRSASSHTGLEKVGESRIYLYVDSGTGRLSLVLTHGIDQDSSGMSQPMSTVNMDIVGLPNGVTLDVVDDPTQSPAEATKSGSTAAGRWNFTNNSDGMVLGGLPFPGVWRVTVTPQFTAGITTWGWVKQDSVRIPLKMTEPITIEAFDTSTFCGTDCKVPRCGDGKFQGGEVCDDGNTVGGDGCSADCKSLR